MAVSSGGCAEGGVQRCPNFTNEYEHVQYRIIFSHRSNTGPTIVLAKGRPPLRPVQRRYLGGDQG